jgi:fluoride ion exporter CrcB/FEX
VSHTFPWWIVAVNSLAALLIALRIFVAWDTKRILAKRAKEKGTATVEADDIAREESQRDDHQ